MCPEELLKFLGVELVDGADQDPVGVGVSHPCCAELHILPCLPFEDVQSETAGFVTERRLMVGASTETQTGQRLQTFEEVIQ